MSKLNETQGRVLRALARLCAYADGVATARQTGQVTGQSSDGAAYTLRSLVSRGLVRHADSGSLDATGYVLTREGMQHLGASGAFVLARYQPQYGGSLNWRPSHIVLDSLTRYGWFTHHALCGTQPTRGLTGELATATCRKCVRRALTLGLIPPPAELGDPVHHGDVLARIEASTR